MILETLKLQQKKKSEEKKEGNKGKEKKKVCREGQIKQD